MKFRQVTATIAIYFLFTLLWFTLNSFASELENRTPDYQLINQINKERHLFYIIFNQFLAIQDILIFRQTCRNFGSLLHPSDKKMVMFCTKFCSEEFDNVLFAWMDLKYVLDQSYYTVFESMEMFNIKEYQYAIVTRTLDKNIISWFNTQYPYAEMLFYKARKEVFAIEQAFALIQYDPPKVYNGQNENMWAQITKVRNVETGGDENHVGYSNDVQSQLKNVKMIVSTYYAFAALLNNGSVIAWGDEDSGGKIPYDIQPQLQHVKMIYSNESAFAALLNDGSVIAWGDKYLGGQIPHDIQPQLQHVKMIYSTDGAFAALLDNGSVFAWGHKNWGGKIPHDIQSKLMENVTMINSTHGAFAALLEDGSVLAWGDEYSGKIPYELKNVKMIYSTAYAFAALLDNGSVFAWGNENWGGKIPPYIQSKLIESVVMILPNYDKFTALCKNNEVIEW